MWMHLLLLVSIVCRLADAGYCTNAYSCPRQCRTSTSYTTSCGLFNWDRCSRRRTVYKYCSNTCYKQVCCDGYTGTYCEIPICFESTSCPNGGICTAPDTCECIDGFSKPYCTDINECSTATHGCQDGCENTPGSYMCTCRDGFSLDSDLRSCFDVNECILDNGGCSTNCENTVGSYNCTCNVGFILDEDGISCIDEDECQLGTSECSHMCTNTLGSYECSCSNGFLLYDHTCYDIDECTDGTAMCDTYCVNNVGSYSCECNAGYVIDESKICQEIDECLANTTVCDQICVNEPGSFHCECTDGYQLNGSSDCVDIDECSVGIAGCSYDCVNEVGYFLCSCPMGFVLSENERACDEINECVDVVCQHGGICVDGLNSFTCSCTSGYTNTYCETDIDECATFNGGCQDNCTNIEGSFVCSCFDERVLQEDGYSCKGGGDYKSVFERYEIPRQLLPTPCFEVSLACGTEGTEIEVSLASTSEWYTSPTDQSVFYTLGISFVKINSFSLPISLQGIEVSLTENSFELRYSITSSGGILKVSTLTSPGCEAFALAQSDMFDFISADSFFKTLFWSLFPQLPSWLEFWRSDQSIMAVQDMKSDLIYGRDIDTIIDCKGAPVIYSHLYSVFQVGTGFSLTILGNNIDFPPLLENRKFCIIVDICTSYGGTIFLMIPEEGRDLLLGLPVFMSLYNASNLLIKPRGVGIPFVDGIHADHNPMVLWNGDTIFHPEMHFADLWIGGDVEMADDSFSIQGRADMFFSVPSVETIVTSTFRDEWNGIIDVSGAIIFKFTLQDQDCEIKFLTVDVDAYISAGGSNRDWCGENSNPAGLYFSLLLEVNPFMDVPFLGEWVLLNTHRLYAFISKDTKKTSDTIQHFSDDIFKISYLVNSTLPIITTSAMELENISNDALSPLLKNITDSLNLIQLIVHSDLNNGWINEDITNIISTIERLTGISTDIKHNLERFNGEVEFIASETIEDLVRSLNVAIETIQEYVTKTLNSITDSFVKEISEHTHFGFKYSTDIVILGLKLRSIDIEIVFSVGNVFQCSRFEKIAEYLNGEKAARLIGRSSVGIKLGYFLHVEAGVGIGGALAMNSDKWIFQFEVFAVMFGVRDTADLFISTRGLYLYLERNIWDTFLAQLDVSAELGKEWYELIFVVEGRFVADAREKRQIQSRSDTFQDSYIDALKKVIGMISDQAQNRLTVFQNLLSKVQNDFAKAQNWLEEKKGDLLEANQVFDNAISSLEKAKLSVENARAPFEKAVEALKAAEKTVDNLCKIRNCPRICIPGIRCKICRKKVWGGRISYPCCGFDRCMISFPEPFCLLANAVCRVLRAIAYAALEVAVAVSRASLVIFDIAKASLTVAQVVVDTSRVALKVAEGVLVVAQVGLEFAKGILEAAKVAFEAVKLVIGTAAKVLELVLEFGLQSILDVKNCGFRLEMTTTDLPVFDVSCEVNAFRLGWTKVEITINFKNILQSIWQAARETITALMKTLGKVITRKRRNIEFNATSKLHRLLRVIRQTNENEHKSLNETVDLTNKLNFINASGDFDAAHRMYSYKEKCQITGKLLDFLQSAFNALQETLNDSMVYIADINSVKDELLHYNVTEAITDDLTAEDIGINKGEAAMYNVTEGDIDKAMEDTKSGFNDEPIILEIKSAANSSLRNVELETKNIESIDFVNIWYTAMDNLTIDYFNETECNGFRDCMFFTISSFYFLYEAEDFPNAPAVRAAILDLESIVIESFQNETLSITDTAISMEYIVKEIHQITKMNPFCSVAPTINRHPKNITALIGTSAMFYCSAVGDPDPVYSWYKNGILIHEERTGTIIVTNITAADHGTKFNCLAGNIVANITSMDAFLLTAESDVDECETNNGDCEYGCLNSVGSYECTCPVGWMINETNGHGCLDSDECKINNGGCDYECVNYDGSYQCICNEGYIGSGNIGQCADINECEIGNGECEQNCTNTDGSYFCECWTGYVLDIDGHHCNDVDDCNEDNAGCEHTCVNTEGSYICTCSPGYILENNFHECSDIDECAINNGDCEQQCINTFGSFLCCDHGFKLDANGLSCIDIDECSIRNGNCSQTCTNIPSSFECGCYEGYELSPATSQCFDTNECEAKISVCEQGCTNTEGSYTCSCFDGYALAIDGKHCVDKNECSVENGGCEYECTNEPGTYICSCPLGYMIASNGYSCLDINECNENNGNCEHSCTNNDGSFTCTCSTGFQLDFDGFKCNDVDECVTENGGCAQDCLNLNGSFDCRCNGGFDGDGIKCTDVDECLTDNGGCDHKCINTNGSFTCTCTEGFILKGDGLKCIDVDECISDNGGCGHNCINTYGSFTCTCNEGFVIEDDRSKCIDVDECISDNGGCGQNCINTHGSFTCACDEGFVIKNDSLKCIDVDECITDNGGCYHNCINTHGSFTCTCNVGFAIYIDSLNCRDLDECIYDNGGCDQICINTNGSFTCACYEGFALDGDDPKCKDVDECIKDNGGCDQICGNSEGSFSCTCKEGFLLDGNGFRCNDLNECSIDNGGCHQRCTNNYGSFSCNCDDGFMLDNDGLQCHDINECNVNNGECEQLCNNAFGSFTCECNIGFVLKNDQMRCEDIDECTKANGGCSHGCENGKGSYKCVCDVGFSLNDGQLVCEDIDECKLSNGGCHQQCVNTDGSFQCVCGPGFRLHKHDVVCLGRSQKAMKTSIMMTFATNPIARKKRSQDMSSNAIKHSLDDFYNKYTSNDVETHVHSLRTLNTTVEVNFTVVYDESDAAGLAIATIDLSSGTQLNYDGIPVASRSYLPENVSNECHVFETMMDECDDGQRCEMTADGPSCLTEDKDPSGVNYPMIILPATGALILCVIVACIAFFVLRVRKQRMARNKRKRYDLPRRRGVFPNSPRAMISRAKPRDYGYGGSPYKY